MDPPGAYPLPNLPPVDLGDLISRTNAASHQLFPLVTTLMAAMDTGISQAEAGIKTAAQPLMRSLARRTNGAQKKLGAALAPVAGALQERTAAAQVRLQQFPVPSMTGPADQWWAVVDTATCQGRVAVAVWDSAGSAWLPPSDLATGEATYGPYTSQDIAQGAVTQYQAYLQISGGCRGVPADIDAPAWWWREVT